MDGTVTGPSGMIGGLAVLPASHSQAGAALARLTVLQPGGERPPVRGRGRGVSPSAAVVGGPVRGAPGVDGVVEDLVLVGRAGHAELAGRTTVLFPGADLELVGPAAVTRAPGVAAAFFGVADADPERGGGGI